MTSSPTPLNVCILCPDQFDEALFLKQVRGCPRPVRLSTAAYADSFELRAGRSNRLPLGKLAALSPQVSLEVRAALANAEVVLALDAPLELPALAPGLRWLQSIGAGVRHLYPEDLLKQGIVVTTASGVSAGSIAEFVFARLLEVRKRLVELHQAQRDHRWMPLWGDRLAGTNLGVIGLGAIGSEVARLGNAFQMNVRAVRKRPGSEDSSPHASVLGREHLDYLLGISDAVVIAVPETTETIGMIGEREIAMMRSGSIICNVARGPVLDEEALKQALRIGHLGAAIVDVTTEEPLPFDDDLWDMPNVYISPHCAGIFPSHRETAVRLFAANVWRYSQGEPMFNVVDANSGY